MVIKKIQNVAIFWFLLRHVGATVDHASSGERAPQKTEGPIGTATRGWFYFGLLLSELCLFSYC